MESLSLSAEPVVRGRVGGFAELACSLTPPSEGATTPNLFPLHVVEWVRLGFNVPILIKFGSYTPRVHPNYKGWFECRILLLDRSSDELQNGTWNFLSITAPPVFVKTPPAFLEVMLGEPLALHCDAHGNPKPKTIWRKYGGEKEDIQVLNETLALSKVTRETTGIYKCHVSNSEGNLTHTTQLQVKGPPIILTGPEDTTMNMSQDAVLQCQAEAYPSNLTYEWWKQGQNVHHIEVLVDGTLLISGLVPEDSGNYTCMPTNGLLTPPSASAYLKVKHPARVVRMPRETYLPVGMGGRITCPVEAEPPMLYVNWTKDGADLDLDQYPGWMVNSEGSVFITAANDDAVGMYTCTAYNSYGTMGQSEPTKDPPSFRVSPRAEYLQEVGRDLVIPCQPQGDPMPNITWLKVGPTPRSPFTVLSNGSLVLRPVSKDHQGAWECLASNRVATVSAATTVLVLGTSPHAVSSVSVDSGVSQANVSWEPGFDGGYTQKFTVWLKPTVRGKHEWASVPVPTSKTSLLVTSLQPATSYQFSVLAQNKLGSGPFSEIVTVRTFASPTEAPSLLSTIPELSPPTLLSVNRTLLGISMQWVPPPEASPPLTSFVLQAKRGKGEWVTVDRNIAVNMTKMIVQGLVKDSNYELRLLSRRDKQLSAPSDPVTISTEGLVVYPEEPSLLESVPEPLLAGVIGGVCFLFVAIILSLVAACVMNNRRRQRRRKKRDDIPSAFQKSSSPKAQSPSDSPDSVLKLKLCPPLNFFPFPNSSSSDRSDRSSFEKASRSEYQDQKKQLLSSSSPPPHYTQFESHFGGSPSPTPAIESISRSPDGRFIIQPDLEIPTPSKLTKNLMKDAPPSPSRESNNGSLRESTKSNSGSSARNEQRDMQSDTLIIRDLERPPHSPGRVRAMARNFSRHGCFHSDDEQGCSEALLEKASFYSENVEKKPSDSLKKYWSATYTDDILSTLTRRAREKERLLHQAQYHSINGDSQLTEPSTMITQLDGDRERDNLSKCLKLVKEREIMEKELEQYTANRRVHLQEREQRRAKSASPLRKRADVESQDPIWKPQHVHLREKSRPGSQAQHTSDYRRGCYFGNTSSPVERHPSSSSSCIQWDLSPVSSPTNLVPVQCLSEGNTPRSLYPHSRYKASANPEDSLTSNVLHSPATLFSPGWDRLSPAKTSVCKNQDRLPETQMEDAKAVPFGTLFEKSLFHDRNMEKEALPSRSSSQLDQKEMHRVVEAEKESIPGPIYLDPRNQTVPVSGVAKASSEALSHNPSSCSTLPYDHQKSRSKGTTFMSGDSLSPCSEQEKEAIRTRSRKSDKCIFGESPSRISPLTLLENESDQSNLSRMSVSVKAKLAPQPSRMSPIQSSTILEYLSLPGFIEMSVDDPVDVTEPSESAEPSVEQETRTILRGDPDVVPELWETHGQENSGINGAVHHQGTVNVPTETSKTQCTSMEEPNSRSYGRDVRLKSGSSGTSNTGLSPSKVKDHPSYLLNSVPQKEVSQCSSAQTLINTAKSMAEIVSQCSDFVSDQDQGQLTQRPQTNTISSRINQAPMPYMKKSISIGPCRTLSGPGQPRPFLKKSISFGSRWEHSETPRPYISETCYRDQLPNPEIRVKSYSLGHPTVHYHPFSGPSWRGAVPFQPPSVERHLHIERSGMMLPYETHGSLVPIHPQYTMESSLPSRRDSDPRRQAAVFSDSSRWPLTYQETLRSVQHKYVPQDSPRPFGPSRTLARVEYFHPSDSRRVPPRPFLPRGYSWPSPYLPNFPQREQEFPRELDKGMGTIRGYAETELRADGGRASYASQSSGRGSVGPYGHLRQSLSITPTLLSSPETTEESERHRADKDLRERRSKRRNTSVDESYEWDAVEYSVNHDVLEAMKTQRFNTVLGQGKEFRQERPRSTAGLQDYQSQRLYSISPSLVTPAPQRRYSRSLSEARFNALRQEFQEYRRAQESITQDPCVPPEPESDSSSAFPGFPEGFT
ncbi:hypothetical protein DNTS_026950 [Danionella cerebrum]|uniref:Uncharacterized protein n=1 Tax=Danionella cerebrum TaxID=2873325 RepID=A0A553N514_9TELE|nr:hypothetical protein DNTS_026950 [Danionella translucida]